MEVETQGRGDQDTPRGRRWGSHLMWFLLLSAVLHLPFTPLGAWLGLLSMFGVGEPVPDMGEIRGIPIELLSDEPEPSEGAKPEPPSSEFVPPEPAPELAPEAPAEAQVPRPDPEEQREKEKLAQGGQDSGPPSRGAAGAPMAEGENPEETLAAKEGAKAADEDKPGGEPVIALGASPMEDANANVRLLLYTEKIREHRLGTRVGKILSSLYQWRDFLGPSGIDPIRDMDRLLILGPQLRDSAEILVVMQHRVQRAKLRAAIDALVARDPEGAWISEKPLAARARADRAVRVFAMMNDGLAVVAPMSAAEAVLKMSSKLSLPRSKGGEVASFYLAEPWKMVAGAPIRIPKTIRWLKCTMDVREQGGVIIYLEAEEESAETAEQTRRQMERAVASIASVKLGIFGSFLGQSEHRFLEGFTFETKGTRVHGTITATDAQVAMGLDLVESMLSRMDPSWPRRPTGPSGPASSAPEAGSAPKVDQRPPAPKKAEASTRSQPNAGSRKPVPPMSGRPAELAPRQAQPAP